MSDALNQDAKLPIAAIDWPLKERFAPIKVRAKGIAWLDLGQFLLLILLLTCLAVDGAQSMQYQWRWDKVPRYLARVIDGELVLGPLLKGLAVTLDLAWKAGLLALAIGLALALLRYSRTIMGPALAWACERYSLSL